METWIHVLGNKKKRRRERCDYCSKTFNGDIFTFKHHFAKIRYDSKPCV